MEQPALGDYLCSFLYYSRGVHKILMKEFIR